MKHTYTHPGIPVLGLPTRFAKALALLGGFLSMSQVTLSQNQNSEDVFELSPFTIDASGDEGYMASQSMAGGRLSSEIKKTGASIQVITEEFMNDIAATNIKGLPV